MAVACQHMDAQKKNNNFFNRLLKIKTYVVILRWKILLPDLDLVRRIKTKKLIIHNLL